MNWLQQHRHLLLVGPTGVGKSYLACALAKAVIEHKRSVRYLRLPRLGDELASLQAQSRTSHWLKTLSRIDLVILDDFGLVPLSPSLQPLLLELLEDRHQRGSLLLTSQLPLKLWHAQFHDPTSLTPSSIASSTAPNWSNSRANPCANAPKPPRPQRTATTRNPKLASPSQPMTALASHRPERWLPIRRNGGFSWAESALHHRGTSHPTHHRASEAHLLHHIARHTWRRQTGELIIHDRSLRDQSARRRVTCLTDSRAGLYAGP
ncbi:MAG: ATP-binding protein [Xanthomonadales bacterium]|nr:ATP-binding protein [Xanthomonadales bacterium]